MKLFNWEKKSASQPANKWVVTVNQIPREQREGCSARLTFRNGSQLEIKVKNPLR